MSWHRIREQINIHVFQILLAQINSILSFNIRRSEKIGLYPT